MERSEWARRQRQWTLFSEWESARRLDTDAAVRLRQVGELLDLWLALGGRVESGVNRNMAVARQVRLMHAGLKETRIFQ